MAKKTKKKDALPLPRIEATKDDGVNIIHKEFNDISVMPCDVAYDGHEDSVDHCRKLAKALKMPLFIERLIREL